MDHIKYTPSEEEKIEEKLYWEVWQGLPKLNFEKANSREGSEALKYDQNGNYIWVPHDTFNVLMENPQSILLALNSKKCSAGKMNVRWLSVQEGSLEKAIEKAKRLNSMREAGR